MDFNLASPFAQQISEVTRLDPGTIRGRSVARMYAIRSAEERVSVLS